jgi:hypothetical protein
MSVDLHNLHLLEINKYWIELTMFKGLALVMYKLISTEHKHITHQLDSRYKRKSRSHLLADNIHLGQIKGQSLGQGHYKMIMNKSFKLSKNLHKFL